MKAVPRVDLKGLYTDVTLVDDAFYGIVPFYADPPVKESELPSEVDAAVMDEPEEEIEPEIAGYIVGVPVPPGLFRPRFDLVAWEVRKEDELSDPSSYWVEGLTAEEIEELTKPQPQESELDQLKQDVTGLKQDTADLASGLDQVARKADDRLEDVSTIGSEQVKQDLATLDLKRQSTVIGGELVKKDIAILDLYQQNQALGQMLAALELKILAGGESNV